MSEFEPPDEERFGSADVPASLSPKRLESVLKHDRGTRRLCFAYATLCLAAVIVIHVLGYDLETGRFHFTTEWGSIKGGVAIAILLLGYLSIRRGTSIRLRK